MQMCVLFKIHRFALWSSKPPHAMPLSSYVHKQNPVHCCFTLPDAGRLQGHVNQKVRVVTPHICSSWSKALKCFSGRSVTTLTFSHKCMSLLLQFQLKCMNLFLPNFSVGGPAWKKETSKNSPQIQSKLKNNVLSRHQCNSITLWPHSNLTKSWVQCLCLTDKRCARKGMQNQQTVASLFWCLTK